MLISDLSVDQLVKLSDELWSFSLAFTTNHPAIHSHPGTIRPGDFFPSQDNMAVGTMVFMAPETFTDVKAQFRRMGREGRGSLTENLFAWPFFFGTTGHVGRDRCPEIPPKKPGKTM